jgi:Tfp pilus assembly protein PilF
VVLDACRDNPFSWKRSGSRGLQVVANQPADSIIVYATSPGSVAADGEGRNSPFTAQLLKNLKTPGLEINEVFRLTGGDVARITGGAQRPGVYSHFYGTAYLGNPPAVAVQPSPAPKPAPAPAPARDAKSYFDSGETFFSWGDYAAAIEEYTQAVRLDPNYALAYRNRGRAYASRNNLDRAIADFTEVIRLDPDDAVAYLLRGQMYVIHGQESYANKGDYDRAIADFTEAIRLDPDDADAYNVRGGAYNSKGDYDRAIADFTQVMLLEPN